MIPNPRNMSTFARKLVTYLWRANRVVSDVATISSNKKYGLASTYPYVDTPRANSLLQHMLELCIQPVVSTPTVSPPYSRKDVLLDKWRKAFHRPGMPMSTGGGGSVS